MASLRIGKHTMTLRRSPLVMGVLNVTPDSFSDGGKFVSHRAAIEHAHRMAADGADIIDIGGESTRPGADAVPLQEELARVVPVIEALAHGGEGRPRLPLPLSIDTHRPEVAEAAILTGCAMVNDISAARDPRMVDVLRKHGHASIVLMHMQGQLPNDVRLQPLKNLDGYFPFTPPGSPEAWTPRAERVRRQILVSQGLWPMPGRTPLNAVVHGRIDQGDYTVEKVYFESAPGFFVTGNLYRPKGRSGPCPAVLSPHGHWADGRFHDAGVANVRKEIVEGAERFEEGGRSPLQARCVQLARMGCVVFHYDMIGYADSVQIPQSPTS